MDAIDKLLEVMGRLRDPGNGCPWDLEQTLASIVPHTLEEAYEVADTIERNDLDELRDELGDLLFQVVFYAQLAREQGRFDFEAVAEAIVDKLIRRHPHVFGEDKTSDPVVLNKAWEAQKAVERSDKAADTGEEAGALHGVPLALPALSRAQKIQRRAARVGFDWPEITPVFAKLDEEVAELRHALDAGQGDQRVTEELGDILFSCVNLARHLGVDAEQALRYAVHKFERRFQHVEAALAGSGRGPEQAALEELDRLWNQAKLKDQQ